MATWRQRAEEHVGDVHEVVCLTTRSEASVLYEVLVSLRSRDETSQYGRPKNVIWRDEVFFGQSDANLSGGEAFVAMAREQARVAHEVWHLTRER